ncbi:hypothetical protein B0H14DRAFT_3449897 [Mycena olivaceomarginata]|nr:hypothetical protein B0H14DRAFT_3449897 [Mycena olivaceomarginata]
MIAVIQGARPPRPSTEQSPQLTDCLWALIQECWAQKYQDRPKIGVFLGSVMSPLHSFCHPSPPMMTPP